MSGMDVTKIGGGGMMGPPGRLCGLRILRML